MPYNVLAKPLLIIDPGHGGKDPGAASQFGHEEDFTLKISLYQYNRFKELGVPVAITRTSDVTLGEDDRVAAVKNSGAKYCLSNHLNAGKGDRAEVIHSIYDDGKLANAIKNQLMATGQTSVKVYCKKYKESDYYYMHRRTGSVCTQIVEYCFIDNAADFNHFYQNWEAYAEAVVKAFCSYTGHPYIPKVVGAALTNTEQQMVQGIGTLKVLEKTVIRDKPVYLGNVKGNVSPGEAYIVHDYQTGWFNIGGWVSAKYVQFIPHNDTKIIR